MKATSAKNAAKKFIIEDDFYIVKTSLAQFNISLLNMFIMVDHPMDHDLIIIFPHEHPN